MAEAAGTFAHRMMSNSFTRSADGTVVTVLNFEGAATGFGVVFGTLSGPLPQAGATSGTCTWTGQAFPEGQPWVLGSGNGTWTQVEGENRWNISFPALEISDGTRLRCEGVLDLATRSLTGQMFPVE